jgi:type I restriction enzyme S subunit
MTSEDFQTRHVKDVVSFAKGKPPAEQPYYGKDAEVYLTPEYLRGGLAYEPIKASKNAVRVGGGETIVLWDGSNAGEVFKAKAGVLSSTMVELQPDDSFEADYFYYAMKGWEGYLKGQTSGSGIPHVDKEVIGKLDLLAFSKHEQTKIAEVLATVDQAIDQTEALIAKQQRIKTGLMQDLLTRGIDEHGQLRTEQTHAFKDSPLGRIPVEWEVLPISHVIADIDAGWSPSCEDVTPGQGEWGVLKVSAISSGVFNPTESKRLPIGLLPLPELEVHKDDVLLSRANGVTELVGRCVYVEATPSRLMLSDKTLRLNPRLEKILPRMLCEQLKAESSRRQILNYISGSSGQKNLSQKQIGSILIALAPIEEQQKLFKLLQNSARQFEFDEVNLKKTKALKTALMQDLLTGSKRVTDLLEPVAA